MFDFLGDIFGGLIGAGGAAAGAQINASSAQAINTQQLQQSMNMAQGTYLPGLIKNATAAGINPLVAMGIKTPNVPSLNVPQPGSGIAEGARQLGGALQGALGEINRVNLDKAKAEAQTARTNSINAAIQTTVQQDIARKVRENPELVPPGWNEPAVQTGFGIPQVESVIKTLRSFSPSKIWQDTSRSLSTGDIFSPSYYNPNFGR